MTRSKAAAPRWRQRALSGGQPAGLGLAVLLACSCAAGSAEPDQPANLAAEHLGTFVWTEDAPDFGGYSGLHLDPGGERFIALSDRATLRWGRIQREAPGGPITAIISEGHARLRDSKGAELAPGGLKGDSEGLAVDRDGHLWISFEGMTRVVGHDRPDSRAHPLPRPDAFREFQRNSSLEALAVTADGTLLTIPERSGAMNRPFPVWRFRDGKWDQPFGIPRRGDFLVVDADVGPDGRLYVLERDFLGLLGFRSRLRRFDLTDAGLENERTLLTSHPLQYDNLEGLSVWQGQDGLHATLISDDNFRMFQRTELVEFRIPD